MSKIFHDLIVQLEDNLDAKVGELVPDYSEYRILRQSVDARRRRVQPHFVYTLEVAGPHESLSQHRWTFDPIKNNSEKPIIIGSGPAGLFCALRLVEQGVPCHLFERGSRAEQRMLGINQFWRYGRLDPRNNVCFGEGGAGLYSDGKLITRIKSPHIPYVLRRLVDFGAPKEIEYLANPHVGSDRLRRVIPKLREFLISKSCEIHFDTQVTEILTQNEVGSKRVLGVKTENGTTFFSPNIVVATGHSAEDMIHHLHDLGVKMTGKSYAVGLRIEHPQLEINKIQYRDFHDHPLLGAANYKLTHHDKKTNTGVYSFCMCPGGYILSSGTDNEGLVCNGMSNFRRNSNWANSAIVVTIDHEKQFGDETLGGLRFRRRLERDAKQAVVDAGGDKQLPAQRLDDFLMGRHTSKLAPYSTPSGAVASRIDRWIPPFVREELQIGLQHFQKSMRGFISPQAQLFAIESRTSCPIRIVRDPLSLESVSHFGLFPAGEGAGYAGGITSAACDGVKIAESILQKISGSTKIQTVALDSST